MLVAAYLVLFAFVMLFAWAIDTRYGRPRSVVRAMKEERNRLAIARAIHAESFPAQSGHQRQAVSKLRVSRPGKLSNTALLPSASHQKFLLSDDQPQAAGMQSIGRGQQRASCFVLEVRGIANPGTGPAFSPKSNPAKLALVPRNR